MQQDTSSEAANAILNAAARETVDPLGIDAPVLNEAEQLAAQTMQPVASDSMDRNGSPQISFADVAQRPVVVSTFSVPYFFSGDATMLGTPIVSADTRTATAELTAGTLGADSELTGVATSNPAVDALFTLPTRQKPVNIRQWQDHWWEVRDWEGNVWTSTSAAASGGSTGILSDSRKAS